MNGVFIFCPASLVRRQTDCGAAHQHTLICRASGTIFVRCLLLRAMRSRTHEYQETGIAIPTYLVVCIFICGMLGWCFYQLMQPKQYANPGATAYKAPPGLGITSLLPTASRHERQLLTVPNAADLAQNAAETTGQSIQIAQPEPASLPEPPAHVKTARTRENVARGRIATRQVQRQVASTQSRFAGVGAAYPRYAPLH
jgi:hypothetical protein